MIYENFEKLDDEKHGRIIKSVIGMDRVKFNKLAEAFASAYDAIQQERLLKGEVTIPRHSRGLSNVGRSKRLNGDANAAPSFLSHPRWPT